MKSLISTLTFALVFVALFSSCKKREDDCPNCGQTQTSTTTNNTTNVVIDNHNTVNNTTDTTTTHLTTTDTTTTTTITSAQIDSTWMLMASQLEPAGEPVYEVGGSGISYNGLCWKKNHTSLHIYLSEQTWGYLHTYCFTQHCDAVAIQISGMNANGYDIVIITQDLHTYTDVCN